MGLIGIEMEWLLKVKIMGKSGPVLVMINW